MKPILFNTEMVKAILEGEKTVTRRVIRPQPRAVYHDGNVYEDADAAVSFIACEDENGKCYTQNSPYRRGDRLYVRETFFYETFYEGADPPPDLSSGECSWRYVYKAENSDYPVFPGHWHPSIHMPKEAARIFLRVTNVRVEKLQDITEDEAEKEGCSREYVDTDVNIKIPAVVQFAELWDGTIKKKNLNQYGWEENPFVWRIEFERISKEEALKEENNG